MRGRIVQVREYVGRRDKYIVVLLTDDTGLYDALKYHDAAVDIEPVWEDPEGDEDGQPD